MKIVCSCALELATTLIMATPLMYNRESTLIAVACILIANKFKPILGIDKWWSYLPELENTEEITIRDLADLIFDSLRYSKTQWSQLDLLYEKSPSLSSPLHSNPSASPSLSSFDGSATPPQKVPLEVYNQIRRGADSSNDSNEDHMLNRFLSQKSYTYGKSPSTPSACSSETNSLGSTGFGNKSKTMPSNFRRKSLAGTFSKPYNMMTANKSTLSPLVKSLKTTSTTEKPELVPEKIYSDKQPENPEQQQPSTGQAESKKSSKNTFENLKTFHSEKPIPTTHIFTPPKPKDRSKSLISPTTSVKFLSAHPAEKKYKTRLLALVQNKEVLNFYASSSGNYKNLNRQEKEVVKAHVKEMKTMKKKRRHSDIGQFSTSVSMKRSFEMSLDEKLEIFREEKMIKLDE